jgi:hypothetical protein
MKKLISEKTIEELFNSGNMRLNVSALDTIVTPQAQAAAQKLGVELVEIQNKTIVSFTDRQKIIQEVQKHFAGGKYSKSKITEAVKKVLTGLNELP